MLKYEYENAIVYITKPTEKHLKNIRKATEKFMKRIIKEEIQNGFDKSNRRTNKPDSYTRKRIRKSKL